MKSRFTKGFTLPEIIVVIGIIGLLSSVILANLMEARGKARDVNRIQSMRQMENALDVYFAENGHYPITLPEGSTQAEIDTCNYYSGYTGWKDPYHNGTNSWVPDLVPKYMSQLPVDPYFATTKNCATEATAYYYKSCDGQNYALVYYCAMERPVTDVEKYYDPARNNRTLRLCRGDTACYQKMGDPGWGIY